MSPARRNHVTLVDVAREANCSVSLASIVMRDAPGASEDSRRRVKAVAKRLGYRPDQRARALRATRSGLIGVTFAIHQPFHAEIVEGLYAAAQASEHELVLSAVVGAIDDRRAAETLLRDRCESLIMIGPSLGRGGLRNLAAEVPVVTVARPMEARDVDVIRTDDAGGISLAVTHLIGLGHQRIVHVSGAAAPSAPEREEGYRQAMGQAGLSRHVQVLAGGVEREDGLRVAAQLTAPSPSQGDRLRIASPHGPTAIVAFNDRLASGIIQGLLTAGVRVPQDVSVVGFDNARRSAGGQVPLTTIDQNAPLMARLALERAIGRAAAEYLPSEQVLVPRLVTRASSGPAPR